MIGDNQNGGIERFKKEQHGKKLNECAILGFVEDQEFVEWLSKINNWIIELSKSDGWDSDEQLINFTSYNQWADAFSRVKRQADFLNLYHFWININ
ncbi:hypothetical protein [Pedobacter sp. UBA5917]|uniref:hypothetical protein n=1 Tax=Pedobacter sp. UBA5917 TaxID=1947061 RepID=UPI0025D6D585|nr:hypothetical protein [Pedobacter sp. UBA5917]